MEAIAAFNARLRADDRLMFAGGLMSPEQAHVVDGRTSPEQLTRGALHAAAEFMSGFWIVRAEHEEEALALAREASRHCNRRVELRPFL
jgi:hypothetical protein